VGAGFWIFHCRLATAADLYYGLEFSCSKDGEKVKGKGEEASGEERDIDQIHNFFIAPLV